MAQVAPPAAAPAEARPTPPPEFTKVCVRCHPSDKIVEGRRYPAQWDQVLEQMVARGAMATDAGARRHLRLSGRAVRPRRDQHGPRRRDRAGPAPRPGRGRDHRPVPAQERRVRRLRGAGRRARSAGCGAPAAARRDRVPGAVTAGAGLLSSRSAPARCSSEPPCRRAATRWRGARSAPPGARRGCARSASCGCGCSRASSAGASSVPSPLDRTRSRAAASASPARRPHRRCRRPAAARSIFSVPRRRGTRARRRPPG